MSRVARAVPAGSLSGVSGVSGHEKRHPGQKIRRDFGALGQSVRGVRANLYCLTHARPREAFLSLGAECKYFLGIFIFPGQPGQKKVSD